jgi:hypothetical protein
VHGEERRKTKMTTYQENNAVAGSTQEVMKVKYTAKTHTRSKGETMTAVKLEIPAA